jgi:hypothetical protein
MPTSPINQNADAARPAASGSQELLKAVLERSTTDARFRQLLVSDSRAAIAEFVGQPVSALPDTFDIAFVENTADATIVLPDFIAQPSELAEEELEMVAGGTTPLCAAVMTAIASAILVTDELYNMYEKHQEQLSCSAT